ncbi:Putative vacuolar membrane transporter for cationic amino acids [Sporothrix curviconia]|uniref:Vacuolar membrane transporter for cationic amino acids n=1 Tax=Sporothrix curviconia TaxID=1260050 RepID=A0ABP0B878_9PEZI
MVPPTGPLNLDVEAISGICGSISIACWVVVFSPQIIENFRRSSADGLSLQFIIVWLAGDVFNILGAVLQGVLPTMIILAVYYTIADIVLLGQCFYYRGFTWRDDVVPPKQKPRRKARRAGAGVLNNNNGSSSIANERTSLLNDTRDNGHAHTHAHTHNHFGHQHERRGSNWSTLSPAVPFVPVAELVADPISTSSGSAMMSAGTTTPAPSSSSRATGTLQTIVFNAVSMLMVCAAGVAGWYLSGGSRGNNSNDDDDVPSGGGSDDSLVFNVWGQFFGYLCAIFYLGSRVPQLLLNWRRQSTDGVSMLFFLFACLGNLTYVLSIFAYDGCSGIALPGDLCSPEDARRQYGRYLLVNLSWLAGSLGTLLLDMCIFVQFFMYRVEGDDDDSFCSGSDYDEDEDVEEGSTDVDVDNADDDDDDERDERPLLRRNMSSYHA